MTRKAKSRNAGSAPKSGGASYFNSDDSHYGCAQTDCLAHELCASVERAAAIGEKSYETDDVSPIQKASPRKMLFHPREWNEFFPIICSGWAAYSAFLLNGTRQVLAFLLEGDLVTTSWFVEPMPVRSIEAITDVSYRKFSRSRFRTLLLSVSKLQTRFLNILSNELKHAEQVSLMLCRRRADERIAEFILSLSAKLATRGKINGQTMEFPLRNREIADATGLTPDHVSKVLVEFQRKGLIKIENNSLSFLKKEEFQRLV